MLYYILLCSFWCNRTDSCDNDGLFAYSQCQPKKTVYEYCEDSYECLQTEGLVCYPDRNQCDCPDLVNNYWSNVSLSCMPKKTFNESCNQINGCFDSKGLECDMNALRCDCKNNTFK